MIAVIFEAITKNLDNEYFEMASKMRDIAMSEYGCKEFVSVNEDGREVTISYWATEEAVLAWKNDSRHIKAQEIGQKKWYESYSVKVTNVLREYGTKT